VEVEVEAMQVEVKKGVILSLSLPEGQEETQEASLLEEEVEEGVYFLMEGVQE
jgi:hypothetical protein